jgi:hypothetical protein
LRSACGAWEFDGMAQVKGSAIAARLNWVRRYHGDAAVDQVRNAMTLSAAAGKLQFGVAKSGWYPFALFIDLIETIDRVLGKGDGALYAEIAGQSAEDDMRTIYKVFFRMMQPLFIVKKASQVWRQHYDSGRLVVVREGECDAELEILDFETPHAVHCESIRGFCLRTTQMTGVANARAVHTQCRAKGDARCVFLMSWGGRPASG